jgi:WD40 repeat protein/energy-coupling factor transporter ATP-binding protein EcfA2
VNTVDVNYDVFLSFHSRDRANVERIASQLRDPELFGFHVFLDQWYLTPGRPWIAELERVLGSCRAVAVLIGPGEMGDWQQREKNFALERQAKDVTFPVIPVLLPGADPALGFLGQNTWIDLRLGVDNSNELGRLAAAIRGEPPGPEPATRAVLSICPYRGLLYFREEDSPFFFGREEATKNLVRAVTNHRFVAVVGASGSGKSSLVRAGLVPQLRREQGPVWEVITIHPDDQPLHQLARALLLLLKPSVGAIERAAEVDSLAQRLADNSVSLRNLALEFVHGQKETTRLMLIVDQWEELFTLTQSDPIRRCFIDQLLEATKSRSLNVVATLRGDFVGRALAHRAWSDEIQNAQVNLGPMTREELETAIEHPAKQVGLRFEPGLVQRILDDVGEEPGNLPLLEFVLKRLWEDRRGQEMQHASYDAMGRLEGAVASKAEEIFASLSSSDQEEARKVFVELVRLGTSGSDTRRRARFETIDESARRLVRRLSDERLLVTSRGDSLDQETVEVSHEALIQNWQRLKGWLEKDREFLAWRDWLRSQLQVWQASNRDEGAILRGVLLLGAERWLQTRASDLSSEERLFIENSVALRTREGRKKKTVISLIVTFLVASSLALSFALLQRQRVAEEEKRALAYKLSVEASSYLSRDPELGVLLAYRAAQEAYSLDRRIGYEASALLEKASRTPIPRTIGLANSRLIDAAIDSHGTAVAVAEEDGLAHIWSVNSGRTNQTFSGHAERLTSIAFSEDGSKILTASWDNTARVWDTKSGKELVKLSGHRDHVFQAVFAPGMISLATASKDGTARIWDATTGSELFPLPKHEKKVYAVAFSPDATLVATASSDKTIMISSASTGTLVKTLQGHGSEVYSVTFSPDGKTLASAGHDTTARVWDVKSGRTLRVLSGHTDSIFKVAFNVLGDQLATASADHTVKLWNPFDGRMLATLSGHKDHVMAVSFLPDDTGLISAGVDKTVRIWQVAQTRRLLIGHTGAVLGISFSPDGSNVATSGYDRTARIWDVRSRRLLLTITGHQAEVNKVVFSPDGRLVATASEDGTARLWAVVTGAEVRSFPHNAEVTSVAFSPDGKTLVSGGKDHTAKVWDVDSGHLIWELRGHANMVQSVAFSFDGSRIATGSFDSTARIWDVKSGHVMLKLIGHERSVEAVNFSVDGNYLATGSADKTARVWDARTGKPFLPPLEGHTKFVIDLAFRPDSKQLATASPDGTVKIWEVPSGALLHTVRGIDDEVRGLSYSADGSLIAIARSNSLGQILDADELVPRTDEQLLELVSEKLTRRFSKTECLRFFHENECNAPRAR